MKKANKAGFPVNTLNCIAKSQVKFYKQTTRFTCGPACVLMILHYYFPQKYLLSRENELRLWQKTVRSPLRGTSIFALASVLQKEGLKTKVYVGKIKYSSLFWQRYKELGITKEDIDLAVEITKFYYQEALENGVGVKKTNLKFGQIDNFVQKSDFVILRTNIAVLKKGEKNLSHYIVIREKKGAKYHIYDPYQREFWLKRDILEKAFTTVKTLCGEDCRVLTVVK